MKKVAKILLIIGLVILAVPVFGLLAWTVTNGLKYGWEDYASKAYQPLHNELINRKFQPVCQYGDAGHGIDNLSPWITTVYTHDGGRADAVSKITTGFARYDYKLRPQLEVSGASQNYINQAWVGDDEKQAMADTIVDVTKPKSPYKPYDRGNIDVSVQVLSPNRTIQTSGVWDGCKDSAYTSTASQTVIEATLKLPSYVEK